MARRATFPGLVDKFHRALAETMRSGDTISSTDILGQIEKAKEQFGISDQEYEHLEANRGYYFRRAKEEGVIEGRGRGRSGGYGLVAAAHADDSDETGPEGSVELGPPIVVQGVNGNTPWESFLHVAASLMLAWEFQAEVRSLPAKGVNVKWANPDLLMVRASGLERRRREIGARYSAILEKLRKVDSTPSLILSSIELKFDIANDRSKMFRAIAEAAANGRWANETWLVFMNREPQGTIDRTALELAQSTGVGIMEIEVVEGLLACQRHREPELRPLVLADHHLTFNADSLLNVAGDMIERFSGNESWLDQVDDVTGLVELIRTLGDNLACQTGFKSSDGLETGFRTLHSRDAQWTRRICSAVLDTLPSLIDRSEEKFETIWRVMEESMDENLTASQTRQVTLLKNLLQRYSGSGLPH